MDALGNNLRRTAFTGLGVMLVGMLLLGILPLIQVAAHYSITLELDVKISCAILFLGGLVAMLPILSASVYMAATHNRCVQKRVAN